ncbi:MAG: FG-GAP repeat domain-containing protein [Planctomycetota bacterium]
MTTGSLPSSFRHAARFAAALLGIATTLAAQCANGPVFTPPTVLPAFTQGRCIVAGDLDGDGDPDLAAGGQPNGVQVWRNDGAAGFVAQAFLPLPGVANDLVLADFDQDGLADLAACGSELQTVGGQVRFQPMVMVLYQRPATGALAFDPPVLVPMGGLVPGGTGTGLVTADFDNDGTLDFAMADQGPPGLWITLGQAPNGRPLRTWAPPQAVALQGSGWQDIAAEDFDNDGVLDLALVSYGDGTLFPGAVQFARGAAPPGSFVPAGRFTAGVSCTALCARDFDGDGDIDVAVSARRVTSLLENQGGMTLGTPIALPVDSGECLAAADLDGDGGIDLCVPRFAQAFGIGNVYVLREVGGALDVRLHNLGTGFPVAVALADFDGDGIVDMAVAKEVGSVAVAFGTCTNGLPSQLQLQAPLGGEQWTVGQQVQIDWLAAPQEAPMDIELSRDGGRTWEPLALGRTTRPFGWTVTPPATNRGLVRVRSASAAAPASASVAPIEIGGPGLAQARPIGAGCGAPTPRLDVAVPRFFGPVAVDVAGAVPGAPVGVYASLPLPAPLALGFGCSAWVDPLGAALLASGVVDASGALAAVVDVPSDAALLAVRFAMQAAVLGGGAAPGVQLTNAYDLLVGL